MSLSGALQIGASALNASQLAIQVTGNNLANAATPGYSRQLAILEASRANNFGTISIGTGVGVSDIQRQVDEALQSRLWSGISQQAAASQDSTILSQVEDSLGQLGDNDLSSQLSSFFNAWSDRANGTGSNAVVIQQGQTLADFIQNLRHTLTSQRDSIDSNLSVRVQSADGILTQIAGLNRSISSAEATGGTANTLRDQRDGLVSQLSQYMDVSTVEQQGGSIDVLVGSTPVVLGGNSRGLQMTQENQNGQVITKVSTKDGAQELAIRSGEIGSLLANRSSTVDSVITKLDTMTSQLIFEVNKLHSTGTTADGLATTTGTLGFSTADRTRALSDPANTTIAGLPFKPVNGGFTVQVKGPNGAMQDVRINVDMDGRDANGAPGYGDDTSLEDIRSSIDAIQGVSATITPDGKLKIDADTGFSFSFTDDSSGALAALGVNSYFTGKNASDIGINAALQANPSQLSTGNMNGDSFVENGTALGIAGLQNAHLAALGGVSISDHWQQTVEQVGVATSAAKGQADASTVVRQSLEAQQAAVSGVSVDEESVNLLTYQQQYQGAAKYISVVDEMMQTLIAIT
jgi:flagellar hook-associated protein 1